MTTQTVAQQRSDARSEYNAYLAMCPSRNLLDRISDKWVALVLVALGQSDKRYSELSRQLVGVSQKMLTQTLRLLERDGLIRRELTLSVPVRADYSLTPLGRSLLPLLASVKEWAESHMDEVLAARTVYDSGA
ncbi:DNA-binding transcriptional regulator, HxlR family [Nakamurella panacisegetis]|uniref:DNA-binding transcriptional regulator, HxlR family n=1 Tax=Nakamurella panacisegetis TaxID=1090615 RepID=A0A1H0K0P7_9ACTN|nr:helix-turn-helix domain-containing protein [Nakamurella panacisegetis]SDO49585.1 DNA-binding transcriptional regulator, HxlR family [Nakamurella panacisegetis]